MGQIWHSSLYLTHLLSELISNQLLHFILTAAHMQYVSTGFFSKKITIISCLDSNI